MKAFIPTLSILLFVGASACNDPFATAAKSQPVSMYDATDVPMATPQQKMHAILLRKHTVVLSLGKEQTNFDLKSFDRNLLPFLKGLDSLNIIFDREARSEDVMKAAKMTDSTGRLIFRLLKM